MRIRCRNLSNVNSDDQASGPLNFVQHDAVERAETLITEGTVDQAKGEPTICFERIFMRRFTTKD